MSDSSFTDGRERYDWKSKYPQEATRKILGEGCYLLVMFFIAIALLFATWKGWFLGFLSPNDTDVCGLRKCAYYSSAGMLGGIIFGMKYFYRAVARGWWHLDRLPWRIMSPFIAMAVAFVVGQLVEANFLNPQSPMTPAGVISIGFLAGYFADEAVGKMYEIATVVFGRTIASKEGNERKGNS